MKGIFILTFLLFSQFFHVNRVRIQANQTQLKERSGRTDMPDKEERRDIYDTDDKTTNDVERRRFKGYRSG